MTDKTDSKEREAFEAWHLTQYPQHIARHGDTYKNAHVRCRWQAWQARASLATSCFDAADMATAWSNGFRDGVASLAASAGSEPVAWPKDAAGVREFVGSHFRSLFYANPVGIAPHDNDTYELTAHDLLSAFRWWAETHPSPPEGMVALPTRHELALQLLVAGGFVKEEKLAQALALVDAACPALSPAQPTSSADSRKGE